MKGAPFAPLLLVAGLVLGCNGEETGSLLIDAPTAPPEYAGWKNPLPDTDEAAARGEKIFRTHCATCHGSAGDGRGPAAVGLNPAPADFTDGTRLAPFDDPFIFYRITKGKRGTAMPAFGATVSEEDRGALIRHLRRLSKAKSSFLGTRKHAGDHE